MTNSATIDKNEILHFAKDSKKWWDEYGPFRQLHRLNPLRMEYIKDQIAQHYNRDISELEILDIGCGGGLVCEELAHMGAKVTGIDADKNAIDVAKDHAKLSKLDINYIAGDAENLDDTYDVVIALEIIEHVTDIKAFIKLCKDRLRPNGLLIMSTLNRTAKSYALGIIATEYILHWIPRGTHKWNKFVKPSEISNHARIYDLSPHDITGLIFNPLDNEFHLSKTYINVNYLISLK